MITTLVQELRARGHKVGPTEAIVLASALKLGVHESSYEKFYWIARSILVHDESKYDDFDQVFSHVFKDVAYRTAAVTDEIRKWLQNPLNRPELTADENAAMGQMGLEELMRLFQERMLEQTERHDGGNHWIGTGGTSPFGTGGVNPNGISLRQGPGNSGPPSGSRSAARFADARRFRGYRHDVTLDVRQFELALRKLRSFDRSGRQDELDIQKSIQATAANFGELELVFSKPRRSNTRVILMMDVGGSMDPYAHTMSQLFSAAKKATHWKELNTFYFHNCIYSKVYGTSDLREPTLVTELIHNKNEKYRLIVVGDASMASYELMGEEGFGFGYTEKRLSGLDWLIQLRLHFKKSIWFNPDFGPSTSAYSSVMDSSEFNDYSTVSIIRKVFPMFGLTLDGLDEGLKILL